MESDSTCTARGPPVAIALEQSGEIDVRVDAVGAQDRVAILVRDLYGCAAELASEK